MQLGDIFAEGIGKILFAAIFAAIGGWSGFKVRQKRARKQVLEVSDKLDLTLKSLGCSSPRIPHSPSLREFISVASICTSMLTRMDYALDHRDASSDSEGPEQGIGPVSPDT